MKFEIRPAKPSDSPDICRVCQATIEHTGPSFYTKDQISAWKGSPDPQKFVKKIKNTKGQFFVATDVDGQIFGMIGYHVDDKGRHRGGPYVHPSVHGHGVGKLLLNKVIECAKENGAEALFVSAPLPSEGFYTKMGFRVLKRTEYTKLAVDLPVFEMELDLTSAG